MRLGGQGALQLRRTGRLVLAPPVSQGFEAHADFGVRPLWKEGLSL